MQKKGKSGKQEDMPNPVPTRKTANPNPNANTGMPMMPICQCQMPNAKMPKPWKNKPGKIDPNLGLLWDLASSTRVPQSYFLVIYILSKDPQNT